MPPAKVCLDEKFGAFDEYWNPRIIGELNGQEVRAAKVKGAFDWHHHSDEDELFWVVRGRLTIQFRDGDVELAPGDMVIVPRGVEHRPVAEDEAWVVLFEPANTRNTGNLENERTVKDMQRL